MSRGPKGQRRPADVIGNAIKVARIATGEEADIAVDDGKGPGREVARQPGREGEGEVAIAQAAGGGRQDGGI